MSDPWDGPPPAGAPCGGVLTDSPEADYSTDDHLPGTAVRDPRCFTEPPF